MSKLPAIPNDRPEAQAELSIEILAAEPAPVVLSAEEKERDRFAHLLLTAWSQVLEEDQRSDQSAMGSKGAVKRGAERPA